VYVKVRNTASLIFSGLIKSLDEDSPVLMKYLVCVHRYRILLIIIITIIIIVIIVICIIIICVMIIIIMMIIIIVIIMIIIIIIIIIKNVLIMLLQLETLSSLM